MPNRERAAETQEELDRYITDEQVAVDWIDDRYDADIAAMSGDDEFMGEDPDAGTSADAEAGDDDQAQVSGVDTQSVLRTFDCRSPRYEGTWLYYYAGCNGVFSRIRRNRVRDIRATGFCRVPTRRFKVFYV